MTELKYYIDYQVKILSKNLQTVLWNLQSFTRSHDCGRHSRVGNGNYDIGENVVLRTLHCQSVWESYQTHLGWKRQGQGEGRVSNGIGCELRSYQQNSWSVQSFRRVLKSMMLLWPYRVIYKYHAVSKWEYKHVLQAGKKCIISWHSIRMLHCVMQINLIEFFLHSLRPRREVTLLHTCHISAASCREEQLGWPWTLPSDEQHAPDLYIHQLYHGVHTHCLVWWFELTPILFSHFQ